MTGKITKGVLFAVGGVSLVLFAAFIYVNNDLMPSSVKQKVQTEYLGKLPIIPGVPSEKGVDSRSSDAANVQSDANLDSDLDSSFNVEEPVDNFDDLVD